MTGRIDRNGTQGAKSATQNSMAGNGDLRNKQQKLQAATGRDGLGESTLACGEGPRGAEGEGKAGKQSSLVCSESRFVRLPPVPALRAVSLLC